MAKDGVWLCQLERFGYDLIVAGRSREEVTEAMSNTYITAYSTENSISEKDLRFALAHRAEYDDDERGAELTEFLRYYDVAMDECNIDFYEYGEVHWE